MHLYFPVAARCPSRRSPWRAESRARSLAVVLTAWASLAAVAAAVDQPEAAPPDPTVPVDGSQRAAARSAERQLPAVRRIRTHIQRMGEESDELIADMASNGFDIPQLTRGDSSLDETKNFSRSLIDGPVTAADAAFVAAKDNPARAAELARTGGSEMARAADSIQRALAEKFQRNADVALRAALEAAIAAQVVLHEGTGVLARQLLEAAPPEDDLRKLQSETQVQAERLLRLRPAAARAASLTDKPVLRAGIERVERSLATRRLDAEAMEAASHLAARRGLDALQKQESVLTGLREVLRELDTAAQRAREAEQRAQLEALQKALERERALHSAVLSVEGATLDARRGDFVREQRTIHDLVPESAAAPRAALADSAQGLPRDPKTDADRKIAAAIAALVAEIGTLEKELENKTPEQKALADLKEAIKEEKKLLDEIKAMDEKTFDEKREEMKKKQEDVAEKAPEAETPDQKDVKKELEDIAEKIPEAPKDDVQKDMENALKAMEEEEKRLEGIVDEQRADEERRENIEQLEDALTQQEKLADETAQMTDEQFEEKRGDVEQQQNDITEKLPDDATTAQEKSKDAADAARNETKEETQKRQEAAAQEMRERIDELKGLDQPDASLEAAERELAETEAALKAQEELRDAVDAQTDEEFETGRDEAAEAQKGVEEAIPENQAEAKKAADEAQKELEKGDREKALEKMDQVAEQLKQAAQEQRKQIEEQKQQQQQQQKQPNQPPDPEAKGESDEHDSGGPGKDKGDKRAVEEGQAFRNAAQQKTNDLTGAYAAKLPPEYRDMLHNYYRTLSETP